MMIIPVGRVSAITTVRTTKNAFLNQQKRGIVSWLTNYPDKIMAKKKIQMKGGTCLGEANPTWWKQPGDLFPLLVGIGLVGFGSYSAARGHWRLATGKEKLPD